MWLNIVGSVLTTVAHGITLMWQENGFVNDCVINRGQWSAGGWARWFVVNMQVVRMTGMGERGW